MIYMSPTSQYVTYTYTTQQLDPILHTKHDATLCECIFLSQKMHIQIPFMSIVLMHYIWS